MPRKRNLLSQSTEEEVRNLEEQLNNLNIQNLTKKVVGHLIWKDEEGKEWYRVFGEWKCTRKRCKKTWSSAYTWISLSKYKEDTPISELDKSQDYYQQECKSCKSKINELLRYKHLEISEDKEVNRPHRSDLCAKCQSGSLCQESLRHQYQQEVNHHRVPYNY